MPHRTLKLSSCLWSLGGNHQVLCYLPKLPGFLVSLGRAYQDLSNLPRLQARWITLCRPSACTTQQANASSCLGWSRRSLPFSAPCARAVWLGGLLCRPSARATQHTEAPWLFGVTGQGPRRTQVMVQRSPAVWVTGWGPTRMQLTEAAQLSGTLCAGLQLESLGPQRLPSCLELLGHFLLFFLKLFLFKILIL